MPGPNLGNAFDRVRQQNAPPVLGSDALIPPLRVPGTFGSFPGNPRNPVSVSAIPPIQSFRDTVRRGAFIRQTETVASVALQRASHNARKLVGSIPRPR